MTSPNLAPVWLLDVDGVINTSRPGWSAAPRPVPTFADRTATDAPLPTWLPDALDELREERVKTGRLEGDLRSQTQAVRELKVDLERADAQVKTLALIRHHHRRPQ